MSEIIVQNKKEFKEAIQNKSEVIIVKGKLAKQLQKASVIRNIDKKKLIAVFGVGAMGVGAATAIGGPAGTALSVAVVAAKLSIEEVAAIAIISLVGYFGIFVLISAFQDYDCEFEANYNMADQDVSIKFKRKSKNK